MDSIRDEIIQELRIIDPIDEKEKKEIQETIDWISSTPTIFRTKKPNTPFKHLACYGLLYDREEQKIHLIDHKVSGLWLPAGGHMENEKPKNSVQREVFEELKVSISNPIPFFLSVGNVGHQHIDVSLWYLIESKVGVAMEADPREINEHRWFPIDELPQKIDPSLKRALKKVI